MPGFTEPHPYYWHELGMRFFGMSKARTRRGTVAIEDFQGMLRLRWSYLGKRHCLTLGVPNSKVNYVVAESRAKVIEGDMVTGNFDPTLRKYKAQRLQVSDSITVEELFDRFIEYKAKRLEAPSMEKYTTLKKPLSAFFREKAAATVTDDLADDFRHYLSGTLAVITLKERMNTLNACWKWAIKQNLLTSNPWLEVAKSVKVPPIQKPKPFSATEVKAILDGFRSDRYYRHYADFVEFLFSTGCRIGEAIGLKWKHLSDDCSTVWIGESVSRGRGRKATKTNRSREFRLTPRLQEMLLNRRPEGCRGDSLVFAAPKGGAMSDDTFNKRAWTKTLAKIGIDYRKPYSCRHTFVSHALSMGMQPLLIAEMTGHDPEILFKHYASSIHGGLELPDLF
jgi:integrase